MKRNTKIALAAFTAAAGSAMAAVDPAVTTAIASQVTDILVVIALGGAAMLTVSGGGVIWQVGSKFVKRISGKA